jgi:hypothetical protein
MKRSHVQAIFLGFLLMSCGGMSGSPQPGEPASLVILANPDDQVSLQYENGMEVIDIRSPSGIGSASFELESGVMPGEIVLRLHLTGLEQFRLSSQACLLQL